ncbi:hypothetical protein L208DRAFT_1417384 [Tricholoma matsutake]|nr:hypothetical protein L208DRAFT_1417384 [Tricholoma matsutake 945]
MKLATNPEFRASLKRVKEEMEKAGLDLNSPVRCSGCSLDCSYCTRSIAGCSRRSHESTEDFRT